MEEETSEEWKTEEYESDGGNSKMSSVIWRVGKKIVISGIVITSAPFVLPPVLLVSTVGFAFAVPFGLVLASYACTEKIMSKLLPLPPSPSEYGEEGVGGMEEFEEDVKKTLEMRTQRIEDEDVNGSVEEDEKGNERVLVKEKDVPVEESSNYYEEDGKPIEEEKDYFDNIEEEEYLVVKQNRVVVVEEAQIPVKEIVKKIEEENLVLGEADGGEEVTNEDCVLEKSKGKEERAMKEGVLYFGVNDDIPTREERTVEEVVKGVEENGYKENNGVLDEKMVTIEVQGMRDDEKLDDMVEEVKPIVETKQMVEERRIGKANDVPIEVEKPVMKKKRMKKKRVRITINKDNSREIADESGLDLYDKETPTLQQYNYEGVEICENRVAPVMTSYHSSTTIGAGIEPQEVSSKPSLCATEECPSDVLGEESADSVLHPVPSERSEIKPAFSEVNTTIPSKEVIYSEEKIWEMIFAMRKIVGYKADIQPNVAEELKALYIFTGVEAPMEFKDPLDLSEVDDKLRLLMAIIGVK